MIISELCTPVFQVSSKDVQISKFAQVIEYLYIRHCSVTSQWNVDYPN